MNHHRRDKAGAIVFVLLVGLAYILGTHAGGYEQDLPTPSVDIMSITDATASDSEYEHWYRYPITQVHRIYDGDTFWLSWDLGFNNLQIINRSIRLLGVDAWEARESKGPHATALTRDFLSTGTLILWSEGQSDNFGRYLATVQKIETGEFLHRHLMDNGGAKPGSRWNNYEIPRGH